jgi:S1-C subfamily serine protease
MSMNRRAVARTGGFVAAGLLGGALALGGVALSGDLGGGTTTVVRTSPPPAVAAATAGAGLSVREIYARAAPGVVQITSTTSTGDTAPNVVPSDQFSLPTVPQQALGSGFVIDKSGHIVTNYHVIEGAEQIEVSFSNQDTLRATLVGSDPSTDLAVLRVQTSSRSLTPLHLGDSGAVRVGDPVVAIGNPFGLARTATDAPINSGNSGGPLLNSSAQVIGVNSQIASAPGVSGNVGIGFAVPSNTVKEVVAQLIDTGKVDRAYLGIAGATITEELARVFRLPVDSGVLVQSVGPGTAAARAGLKGGSTDVVLAGDGYTLGGDVIVALGGRRIASLEELRDMLARHKPGQTVKLAIYRGSERKTLDVKLGRQPVSPRG